MSPRWPSAVGWPAPATAAPRRSGAISPGRPPRLSPAQKRSIPELLWHGPEAYGFRGQVWTCARIAKVIEWEFGVRYHKDHVGRILKGLHWTPQQPIRRATQRDDEAIQRWRDEVWPELRRRAGRKRRTLVYEDESGFYLLPGVVKTYAPEGLTPVLREKQTRDHLSVMGGMTPEGHVYTLVRPEPLNGLHCIEFLLHLLRVAGQRLLVIWDGSPIHRRVEVREFVSSTRGRVWLEALPGYAPDLNPWDEGGWHHLKDVEMREPGVPRPGRVASGTRPCRRAPATEASSGPFLLFTDRLELEGNLNLFAQRSVTRSTSELGRSGSQRTGSWSKKRRS